jgi:hypothetical protein
MRFFSFFLSCALSLPIAAQANILAFEDEFYVRLDDYFLSGGYAGYEIYDTYYGTTRTYQWFEDTYGVEWFRGMRERESRSAKITVHSLDGTTDADMISRVSFTVDGCLFCGYLWAPDSYVPRFSSDAGGTSLHLDAWTIASTFRLSLPNHGVGEIWEFTENFPALPAPPGEDGRFHHSFSDEGFRFSTSQDPFDDMVVTPLPASVLFLLAGLGGMGLLARRKRIA